MQGRYAVTGLRVVGLAVLECCVHGIRTIVWFDDPIGMPCMDHHISASVGSLTAAIVQPSPVCPGKTLHVIR